jgi:hypothetical protein
MFDYLNYYTIAFLGGLAEALILMFMMMVTILAHLAAALICKAEALVRRLVGVQDAINVYLAERGANLQK